MENKTLEKVLDIAGSTTKLAANLSEVKTEKKPQPLNKTDDNSNKAQTGSQSVNVMVGSGHKKEPRPIEEKHIHVFPENRALTSEECELDFKKAQMEYELKSRQETYFQKCCDREWQHQMEVDKKNEKKRKIRRIVAGILCTLGIGATGYSIWSDYKHSKTVVPAQKLPETGTVKAEGDVK